ncbi:hypothetical protein BJ170DRAFT_687434 [Xylariales sp. AK1849]|nr:hypothetical protein BJ170DRAFT_687434 [Xylariales sp. AK1849]
MLSGSRKRAASVPCPNDEDSKKAKLKDDIAPGTPTPAVGGHQDTVIGGMTGLTMSDERALVNADDEVTTGNRTATIARNALAYSDSQFFPNTTHGNAVGDSRMNEGVASGSNAYVNGGIRDEQQAAGTDTVYAYGDDRNRQGVPSTGNVHDGGSSMPHNRYTDMDGSSSESEDGEVRIQKHPRTGIYKKYLSPKRLLQPIAASKTDMFRHMKDSIPEIKAKTINEFPKPHSDFFIHTGLPRVRNVELNPQFRGQTCFDEKWHSNPHALAVYLTGEESDEPCKKCVGGSGPFVGCVMPAESIRNKIKVIACANCIYGWQAGKCSHHVPDPKRLVPSRPTPRASTTTPAPSLSRVGTLPTTPGPSLLMSGPLPAVSAQALPARQDPKSRFKVTVKREPADSDQDEDQDNVKSAEPALGLPHNTAREAADGVPDGWGLAPGVVRGEGNQNIGFSGDYLANGIRPAAIDRGMGLNHTTIQPGMSRRWMAEADVMRMCIVSEGHVHVRLEGKEFDSGFKAAIKIRPGHECVFENRSFLDATIFVVTWDEF